MRDRRWGILDVGTDQLVKFTIARWEHQICGPDHRPLPREGPDALAGPLFAPASGEHAALAFERLHHESPVVGDVDLGTRQEGDVRVALVVDGQEILNYGRQSIPSFVPGHRLNSGAFGCMGVGLPFGVGAKVAKPDAQVLVLHGDGSFGINAMEIDTAVRHRVPVVVRQRCILERIELNLAWPWRLENYPEAWVATRIGTLYWNSVYISTVSMVLTVAISALAGYGLGRLEVPGQPYVFALILIGLTIPLQIALIPLFVNLRALGLMNTPLALIGPYTAFGLAFGTYIMKAFFEELPRELEEAARIDGASDARIFWQIMLPLTRPALATISIFLFLQNWNEFLFALTFVRSESLRTLPVGLAFFVEQERVDHGAIMAASLLFTLPVVVFFLFVHKRLTTGLVAGAVKG